ncbi:MAG: hypothetical protein ABIJ75_10550 [Actinomycetota bacterium]
MQYRYRKEDEMMEPPTRLPEVDGLTNRRVNVIPLAIVGDVRRVGNRLEFTVATDLVLPENSENRLWLLEECEE